jgi:hypothetical protein
MHYRIGDVANYIVVFFLRILAAFKGNDDESSINHCDANEHAENIFGNLERAAPQSVVVINYERNSRSFFVGVASNKAYFRETPLTTTHERMPRYK